MGKCYIIIVDTINNIKFNSKKIKSFLRDAFLTDNDVFDHTKLFFERNIEFIEFDKTCDGGLIERAVLKEHLFVNIISTKTKQNKEIDIYDFDKSNKESYHGSFYYRQFNHLKHAFTPRNSNALYIAVDDGEELVHEAGFVESWTEINWFGLTTEICRDQIVHISSNRSYEAQIKRWLLLKLINVGGNFTFYCLPILTRMMSTFCGLVDMDDSTLLADDCISDTQDCYATMMSRTLAYIEQPPTYNRPIFLHSDCHVDWNTVKRTIYSHFSSHCHYIGHYRARFHPLCQDVNFLLVCLLRFFKVYPKNDQLCFSTAQMATLVSDSLRTSGCLPTSKKYVFVIEDVDWISSNNIPGHGCSWLPEKLAANIFVIMTSARDSYQEKSLKVRLCPPFFIDVTFSQCHLGEPSKSCSCNQQWCVPRLLQANDILQQMLSLANVNGLGDDLIRILSIFHCSAASSLTFSQIGFLLLHITPSVYIASEDNVTEKDEVEETEKSRMNGTKMQTKWPLSDRVEKVLSHLVLSRILCRTFTKHSCESSYALCVPQLKGLLAPLICDRVSPEEIESIKCYLAAYLVYHCTDFHQQILFVPTLLQYLSSVKDVLLTCWLLQWPVLMQYSDEYSVPVKLLCLWRSILGPDTDYNAMLNAYIATCLPRLRTDTDCQFCRGCHHEVMLDHGDVRLDSLLQPTIDLPRKATRNRCRILLELARLAMQVGQYSVAKEMARVLLKLLDQSASDRSIWTIPGPDKALLASCLHLLFCTLDERLKTFEFVTEQTTPIFRRTVHYGARALLLQSTIVEQLQRTMSRDQSATSSGAGDVVHVDVGRLERKLCVAEVLLARIMTHFVFSLDGVEQTAINRHFVPAKIRAVTNVCMSRAYEIATRLRDRSLLLEIQMTFGVIQPRENFKEKILLYKTPLRQALSIYGQSHIFVSRIYINIGISYEEQKKYIKAYEFFTLWSHITHELLGRSHCKSIRSCGVFKEPIFQLTAEFIGNLNGESPSDWLEEELKSAVGHGDEDLTQEIGGQDLSVEGVRLGTEGPAGGGGTSGLWAENVSLENMFALRTSLEQDTDWEIHSSDDETPNYTTAFEEVIDKFQKKSTATTATDMLRSLLDSSLVDPDDLSKDDIAFLFKSIESATERLSEASSDSQSLEGSVVEALRITRLFRGLQDLSQIFPVSTPGSSIDLGLASRLLELQRDLQDFLYN